MANQRPFTWKPSDVIEVTNTTGENILLDLDSGRLRLDAGRTTRLTASAREQPQLTALVNQGRVKVRSYNWKK
jgi:hypothetical protein